MPFGAKPHHFRSQNCGLGPNGGCAGPAPMRQGSEGRGEQLAAGQDAGCAVAAFIAGQEGVHRMAAPGAGEVVRQVLVVVTDGVPHGPVPFASFGSSRVHPWCISSRSNRGRNAGNGPSGPCGQDESHHCWGSRGEGTELATGREPQTQGRPRQPEGGQTDDEEPGGVALAEVAHPVRERVTPAGTSRAQIAVPSSQPSAAAARPAPRLPATFQTEVTSSPSSYRRTVS